MRTRNSNFPNNSNVTIPRRRNRGRAPNIVEPELRTIVAPMAERTMEELLRAPTEGYGEAIVLPEINADHFEIKTNLLQLVQANPFHGYERENPHAHINSFKRITSTLRFRDVPNDVIKLMMFPYSLEGNARLWMNTTSRENVSKTDERIDKLADQLSTLVEIVSKKVVTPAPVKAVEETCVTCGGGPCLVFYITEYMESALVYWHVEGCNKIPPPVNPILILEPDVPKSLPKPSIPYPSRRNDQKSCDKASNQMEKIFQIFQELRFNISFVDALLLMPIFAPTIKSLLLNKDKLLELAKIPLNENCSAMLLKKLLEKLGDPVKFLIPSDPRVPLILRRSFLRTGRALIDVYGEEITLRVDNEAVTFNLNQTTRYSSTYDDTSINRIDVIDVACEEFSQEVLGFLNISSGGNPTSSSDPILSSTTPSFTPFEGGEFILEEMETFLQTPDEFTDLDDDFYDAEGDIIYLEQLLNEDPSPTLSSKKNEELKEVTKAKPSIEEPPELKLKDLPSHLEYAYLEENDKLPVVIAKGLKVVEKEALLKVLKSHKRAITWKITDIKGIDSRFCTHKILMEDDYKPTVQSQRQVNPKIHEVIKKEVLKLLDAGMIYLISDSPWVSPVHCVPKKGGITVIANEDNELIPTHLVTGWRVCIDYRKLNEATRKDHFPLLFMNQMLERLAGNEFYCFLDGFLRYLQMPIDP
ncbi:hypothetical protein Tco_1197581 [Tanacetum coccineum]